MKIRNGFVSNSSSSSFVVIGKMKQGIPSLHDAYIHDNKLMIPQTFGGEWDFTQCQTFNSFPDRLNFAALCCYYKEGPNGFDNSGKAIWTNMLEKVLIDTIENVECIKINFRWDDDNSYAYQDPMCVYDCNFIPHNSHPDGNINIAEIFKNEENLKAFLFAPDSEIRTTYE